MRRQWISAFSFFCIASLLGGVDAIAQQTPGRGAVPPPNLDALATTQREITAVTSVLLQSAPLNKPPRPACSPAMPSFDWRDSKKVSPIQNQAACGDCWAFAAIAAYESSDLIENGATAGTPSIGDASEKQALDCAYVVYSCAGGWHDKVLDYFVSPKESTRASYAPYNGVKEACQNPPSRVDHALR